MAEHPLLLSETRPSGDPGELLWLACARDGRPFFFWENPSSGFSIAALGAAAYIRAAGARRFEEASRQAIRALSSLGGGPSGVDGPLVVGGFGFSDQDSEATEWREFPAVHLFVPELLWVRRPNRCFLTKVWRDGQRGQLDELYSRTLALAASRPSESRVGNFSFTRFSVPGERSQWDHRVERARSLIADGTLSKVVIGRRVEANLRADASLAGILIAARRNRRSCFNFWLSGRETSFLGSTPELLVRVEGESVQSGALAGSAPRGATGDEDRAFGQELLASAKNALEHRLVVSAVTSALGTVAESVMVPHRPALMLLPEAQHLYTPVSGRLRCKRTALEVAGLIHPTPAVCGVPREAAREVIESEEPGRGWYTGGVGWMAGSGDGEFAVALRSALADGCRLLVWAGAGIVEGSDPQSEFEETEAKMTALFQGARIEQAA